MMKDKEVKDYLKSLKNFKVEIDNVRDFAGQIIRCWVIRELKDRIESANSELEKLSGAESIEDIIETVESPITKFTATLGDSSENTLSLRDTTRDYIQHLIDHPRDLCGLSTGFPTLDACAGTLLRRGSVTVGAARPGAGKTTTSNAIALHNGSQQIPVLVLDAEMTEQDLQPRIVANFAGVSIEDIEKGRIGQNEYKKDKVFEAIDNFEKMPIHYKSVNGFNFEQIVSVARRWILKEVGIDPETGVTRDCLIILDYLKVMGEGGVSRDIKEYQALGFAMQHLTHLAITMSVPILALVQENKEGFISQSDRIVWLAATVFMLQEKTDDEIAEDGPELGNRKVTFLKTRFGPGIPWNDYLCMNLNGPINKLTEIGLRSQAKNSVKAAPTDGFSTDEPLNVPNET
jgi:replicative DNA helicase